MVILSVEVKNKSIYWKNQIFHCPPTIFHWWKIFLPSRFRLVLIRAIPHLNCNQIGSYSQLPLPDLNLLGRCWSLFWNWSRMRRKYLCGTHATFVYLHFFETNSKIFHSRSNQYQMTCSFQVVLTFKFQLGRHRGGSEVRTKDAQDK